MVLTFLNFLVIILNKKIKEAITLIINLSSSARSPPDWLSLVWLIEGLYKILTSVVPLAGT